MYDSIAILKKTTTTDRDEYGNPLTVTEERRVFVQPRGVYASEVYQAAQAGLKPSLTLTLTNRADYNNEEMVEFEGAEYDIIRTDWNAQRDSIRLVCQPRIGDLT